MNRRKAITTEASGPGPLRCRPHSPFRHGIFITKHTKTTKDTKKSLTSQQIAGGLLRDKIFVLPDPDDCKMACRQPGAWQPGQLLFFKKELLALLFLIGVAHAQPAPPDPDWPCQQNLVATLSAGEFWSGPKPVADPNWRDDTPVFGLVSDISDRDTPAEEGGKKLAAYAAGIPAAQRVAKLPQLFGDIVEQINEERSDLIARLKRLGHRQRILGDKITELSAEADKIPAGATGADGERRTLIVGDRDLTIRGFQQTQRSLRYACEAPGSLDRRLGQYAQILMRAMKSP